MREREREDTEKASRYLAIDEEPAVFPSVVLGYIRKREDRAIAAVRVTHPRLYEKNVHDLVSSPSKGRTRSQKGRWEMQRK